MEFYSDPYLTKQGFKARLLRVGKHGKEFKFIKDIEKVWYHYRVIAYCLYYAYDHIMQSD